MLRRGDGDDFKMISEKALAKRNGKKNAKKRPFGKLSWDELLERRDNIEKTLKESYQNLADFVEAFKGPLLVPPNIVTFGKLEGYYNRSLNRVIDINDSLLLRYKIDLDLYDKKNSELIDRMDEKNAPYMKVEREAIRSEWDQLTLESRTTVKAVPWLPHGASVVVNGYDRRNGNY